MNPQIKSSKSVAYTESSVHHHHQRPEKENVQKSSENHLKKEVPTKFNNALIRNPLSNLPANFSISRSAARPNLHNLSKLPAKSEFSVTKSVTTTNYKQTIFQGRVRSKSTSTVEKVSSITTRTSSPSVSNKRKIDQVLVDEQNDKDNDLEDEEVFVDAQEFFALADASNETEENILNEEKLSSLKNQTVETFPIARSFSRDLKNDQGVQHQGAQPKKQKTELVRKLSNRYNRTNLELIFTNCMYNSEYMTDNYRYMLKAEDAFIIRKSRLVRVDADRRMVVVNWMIYVQQYFNLQDSTFLVSVRIFDRVLSLIKVDAESYILVAIACLWIANKLMDSQRITVSKVFAMVDGKFSRRRILSMEQKILTVINFELNIVEPQTLLFYYMKNENRHTNMKLFYCAEFLLECFTLLIDYSTTHPSLLACCAFYLSLVKLQIDPNSFLQVVDNHVLDRVAFIKFAEKLRKMVEAVLKCTIACDRLIKKYSTLRTFSIASEFL